MDSIRLEVLLAVLKEVMRADIEMIWSVEVVLPNPREDGKSREMREFSSKQIY